ncbi:lipocalin-like domain-containing protein [Candidatus Bathyarchaeota archaeon]|nr:MAG: lipocalin-like domain-containing protein [Candidatus Bathyarchaeota archaeon]
MEKSIRNSATMVGAWKLTSLKIQKANGEVVYPFGKNARGSIIYTDSGRFSAQVMRPDRPKFTSGDQMKGTSEEIKANYEGYVSYYGSYEFDNEYGFIIHHVEGSLFPNWEGQGLKRFFELSGNRLKISTPPTLWGGGREVVILIWERIV